MTSAIVKHIDSTSVARGLQIDSMNDLARFGEMLAKSGYFKDAREAAQACVKVQAGLELGIPPVQAMTGIHIVEGKPTISAALIATLVKRSGKYNYRIVKHDEDACVIAFFEGKEKVGDSSFTMKDAEKAGVTRNPTWSKYRRNMLFARAMSNGARWFTPDIFGGAIFTPEEMGLDVNEDGEPLTVAPAARTSAPVVVTTPPAPATETVASLKKAAWSELDRLEVATDLSGTPQKEARGAVIVRLAGRMPVTAAEWAAAVEMLKAEPTPTRVERDPGADDEAGDEG